MNDFFAKIGRFFWSWGFLKFVLWSFTLIVLFYVEEDWRGARMWAQTKAKWEAKGESFDFNRLIPPPIPDSENLAALPLFKMEPDPKHNGRLEPLTLIRALGQQPGSSFALSSGIGSWQHGKLLDFKKIDRNISDAYEKTFHAAPTGDPLAQFEALYPFQTELRTASITRSYCRFPQSYQPPEPDDLYISMLNAQVPLSQILTLHAVLALKAGKSDLALNDFKTSLKLISGLMHEPTLAAGGSAIASMSIGDAVICNGLALHSWNDAQLAELQNELAQIDFLTAYQSSQRGEALGQIIPGYDFLKKNRARLVSDLKTLREAEPQFKYPRFHPTLWPDGWLDDEKAQFVALHLEAAECADPQAHMIFPQGIDQLTESIAQKQGRIDARAPWIFFFLQGAPFVVGWLQTFAQSQVWMDEALIACALERYRLVHGTYPGSLDELIPGNAARLPHDIMNGQPYHYRLQPDGTFLLYSVGWNEIDDGGQSAYKKGISPPRPDLKHGDWVWPTLQ